MPTFTSSKSPVKAFMFSLSLSSFHFFFEALPFFLIKGKECSPISVSNIAWCNISMSLAFSLSFYSIYVLYKDMERPKKKKKNQFILSSVRGKNERSLRSSSILIAIQSVAQFSNCENVKVLDWPIKPVMQLSWGHALTDSYP